MSNRAHNLHRQGAHLPLYPLVLTDMGHGGEAVGRHEGRVIFVPYGIPGETVRVQLVEERTHYARGRIVELLKASPDRVVPPCPYFGLCGGCHWQQIAYERQLRLKEEIVRNLLWRIGKQAGAPVRPTLGMEHPWAYRNHVQCVLADGRIGYYASQSHELVAVERCAITHPALQTLWRVIAEMPWGLRRASLRVGTATGERLVILEGGRHPEALVQRLEAQGVSCVQKARGDHWRVLCGMDAYHERLDERTYRVSALSFFQVNTAQAERLLAVVGEYLALRPEETLLDVYCGVGLLALSLAATRTCRGAGRVIGIESSPWAIRDAVANTKALSDLCAEVAFHEGSVEDVLPQLTCRPDAIVLDPPRAGCSSRALDALLACDARRIVYVSCDPATLARDISRCVARGYELLAVQPIDMFPQTYHIECVALLRRRDSVAAG